MADNASGTGFGGTEVQIAFDEISSVKYQRVKPSIGADGSATDLAFGQAAMAASLPVVIASNQSAVPVTGTVAATGTFSLSDALPAGTNNIGDVDVASVPKTSQTTRTPVWASGLHLTVAGTSNRTTAITGTEVMIAPTVNCYVRIGNSSVVATEGAASLYLAAGSGPHYFQITTGDYVAAIKATGASDGVASVIPIA